jgi:xanthine dehydrogenase molybdopterin-binding subunit B
MEIKLSSNQFLPFALVLGLVAQASAFWVLGCGKPVAVERIDPIVSPGTASSHAHTVMGGNAFDWTMDFNKTQTSKCTTCGVTKDLSNYWVPNVYFHADNGSFISVGQVGGVNVYYQLVSLEVKLKRTY